jgi:2-oxoglutarate ferredoxin oxidoreductase subunit gamma
VVISDEEIDYPMATRPDLLLAMNQSACDAYYYDLKPEGMLVVDSTFVTSSPTTKAVCIPFTQLARQELGREMAANIVALGALATLTKVVSPEALETAVLSRVPPGTEELNRRALELGSRKAQEILEERQPETMRGHGPDHEVAPYE